MFTTNDYEEIDLFGIPKKAMCIGGGSWTTAYASGRYVYLMVSSGDNSKRYMSELPAMKHLPELKYLGEYNGEDIFQSKRYRKLKSRKNWIYYERLEDLVHSARTSCPYTQRWHIRRNIGSCKIPMSIKRALLAIVDQFEESEYFLEIKDFNLAEDKDGNLILLDLPYPQQEDSNYD